MFRRSRRVMETKLEAFFEELERSGVDDRRRQQSEEASAKTRTTNPLPLSGLRTRVMNGGAGLNGGQESFRVRPQSVMLKDP